MFDLDPSYILSLIFLITIVVIAIALVCTIYARDKREDMMLSYSKSGMRSGGGAVKGPLPALVPAESSLHGETSPQKGQVQTEVDIIEKRIKETEEQARVLAERIAKENEEKAKREEEAVAIEAAAKAEATAKAEKEKAEQQQFEQQTDVTNFLINITSAIEKAANLLLQVPGLKPIKKSSQSSMYTIDDDEDVVSSYVGPNINEHYGKVLADDSITDDYKAHELRELFAKLELNIPYVNKLSYDTLLEIYTELAKKVGEMKAPYINHEHSYE